MPPEPHRRTEHVTEPGRLRNLTVPPDGISGAISTVCPHQGATFNFAPLRLQVSHSAAYLRR